MKLDQELLRTDLNAFYEMALRLSLPHKADAPNPETLAKASEEELINLAADEGWDLGKYIVEA